jgi:hypothetical protein
LEKRRRKDGVRPDLLEPPSDGDLSLIGRSDLGERSRGKVEGVVRGTGRAQTRVGRRRDSGVSFEIQTIVVEDNEKMDGLKCRQGR